MLNLNLTITIFRFYTWDDLKGINLDITMLFIDGLFYFLVIGKTIKILF